MTGHFTAVWQDAVYGARALRKNVGSTAVAVIALALGIGANAAIFSLVNQVLLRPLPYRAPDQIVSMRYNISPANYLDWREQNQTFAEMGAYTENFYNVSGGEEYPERVAGAVASAGLFRALGVNAARGRLFTEDDEVWDRRESIAVLSDGLWRRRFGADPDIVGRPIRVNGMPHTVIGVMPPDVVFSPRHYEIYTPLRFNDGQRVNRVGGYLSTIARLRDGVSLAQAQAEMRAIWVRLAELYPDAVGRWRVRGEWLRTLHRDLAGDARTVLLILLGAVALLLLIACANVANMLLARSAGRQREMAIRAALGAGRWRLIRQLLIESLLLALAGGAAGLLVAGWGLDLLVALAPTSVPRLDQARLDWALVGYTLLISILTGVVFGTLPALQASLIDVQENLKDGAKSTAGAGRRRAREVLIVAEVALSLTLLIGAGLLAKSFINLLRADLGFRSENVLAMDISLPYRYDEVHDRAAFYKQLVERVRALPGVASAAVAQSVPLSGEEHGGSFQIVGDDRPPEERRHGMIFHRVSDGYWETLGVRLIKGRTLTERDTGDAPLVALISESLARQYFPNQDPLGKQLITYSNRPREIVGVVSDVRYVAPDKEPFPAVYVSYLEQPWPHMSLMVRAARDQSSLHAAVRQELARIDPEVPLANVKTLDEYAAAIVDAPRFSMWLLGAFAVIALLLASVGLYGVMSYTVTQRTHEIGVRMALGARAGDVLRLIVGQGLRLALIGVAAGVAGALALTRLMRGLLYGVGASDPLTFVGVSLLLIAVALVACYVPARRAARVDPLRALHYE